MSDQAFMDEHQLTARILSILQIAQLSVTIKSLQIFFLLPYQNKFIHHIGRLLIIFFLFVSFALAGIKVLEELKESNINLNTLAECVIQLTLNLDYILIYVVLIFKIKRVTITIKMILDIYESYDEVGKDIISRVMKIAVQLIHYSAVSFFLLCTSYAVAPVIVPIILTWILPQNQTFDKSLPLNMECFVDENKYFYYIFAYQFLVLMVFCWFPISFNNLQCITIGFIMGHIQCLRYYLNEIDIEFEQNEETKNYLLDRKLIQLIRQHQSCIKLYEHLDNIGRPIFFLVIMCITFHLVCSGTGMIILLDSDLSGAAKMYIIYSTSIISFMLICIPSQLLSNASYEFHTESNCINLHKYPPKTRVILMMMRMKTTNTLVLRAGPIYELNFKTFSVVLKSSFSFVTTFRSLYDSL